MERLTAAMLLVLLVLSRPAEAADDGDDFSNNLFSDLAPLLTLFGEQVAKQYVTFTRLASFLRSSRFLGL